MHRTGTTRISLALVTALAAMGTNAETFEGTVTMNGAPAGFKHVYVYAEEEGFHNADDPTWTILLTSEEVAARNVTDFFLDPSLRIKVTLTSEYSDTGEPYLDVFSQTFYVDGKSLSGGTYPELALDRYGEGGLAGRIYHEEQQEFFDDTFFYDFSFDAAIVDPNAPLGEILPAGGGEPGKAYVSWTRALEKGDVEALGKLVTPEMAAMLAMPEAAEEIEFMAALTPTDVKVLGGSTDGLIAIISVEGMMAGEAVSGEVTLEKTEGLWMPTEESF